MSMLESDAARKLCPILTGKIVGEPFTHCQGSFCVMWVRHDMANPNRYKNPNDAWLAPHHPDYVSCGDCGLKKGGEYHE